MDGAQPVHRVVWSRTGGASDEKPGLSATIQGWLCGSNHLWRCRCMDGVERFRSLEPCSADAHLYYGLHLPDLGIVLVEAGSDLSFEIAALTLRFWIAPIALRAPKYAL